MGAANLTQLDPWDRESGALNVIIETSKGCRNKLRYDPGQGLFELSTVLPRGMVFPFDFGFIPSTVGDDGDPIDMLVLMDEPVPAGCKIPARLIGVIEAEQTQDGQKGRNDRLIAVSEHCHDHQGARSIEDLDEQVVSQIEHFFVSYNEMEGKRFKPLGYHGPNAAEKLVKKAAKRFRGQANDSNGQAQTNGKRKAGKH